MFVGLLLLSDETKTKDIFNYSHLRYNVLPGSLGCVTI